jgi:dolichyl-phosphate beta-glucosyltransferase
MTKGLVPRGPATRGVVLASEEARAVRRPYFLDRVKRAETARPSLSVVVPAYNEEHRLSETLPVIWDYLQDLFPHFELIVVDDGSQDSTPLVVEAFGRDHPGVRLISYQPNRGKGYAVRAGILDAGCELVLFCDADLSTPITEVESLLTRIDTGSDIAIGSRAVPGADLEVHQPWYRELAGRSFNPLAQLLATPGLQDTHCGFKLFHRSVAQDVFGRVIEEGFGFDVEALYIAISLGYAVGEVPVRWMHREGSKVRLVRDASRMFLALIRIRRRHHALRAVAYEPSRV